MLHYYKMSHLNELFGQSFADREEFVQHWNIRLHDQRGLYESLSAEKICNYLNSANWWCEKAVFQKEFSMFGYPHWHIHLTTRDTTETSAYNIERLFDFDDLKSEYVKPVRSINGSLAYCTKDVTRAEGPYQWQRGTSSNAPEVVGGILSYFKTP